MKKDIRLSRIVSSDTRMDIIDKLYLLDTPINTYTSTCPACSFPDINTVPKPYYILRRRIGIPQEIQVADLGNILVSKRVKRIIEILFPGQCIFHKTYTFEEKLLTKWWLAEVVHSEVSAEISEGVKKCSHCNEPYSSHGTQQKYMNYDIVSEYDIVKSKSWFSCSEKDWKETWISRDLFLSVRLINLLKKVKAVGIYQDADSNFKKLLKEEKDWIEEALQKIAAVDEKLLSPNDYARISENDIQKMKEVLLPHIGITDNYQTNSSYQGFSLTEPLQLLAGITGEICFDEKAGATLYTQNDWELGKRIKKTASVVLVTFARDQYGNTWQFDIKNPFHPVYYWDHETDEKDVANQTIAEFIINNLS